MATHPPLAGGRPFASGTGRARRSSCCLCGLCTDSLKGKLVRTVLVCVVAMPGNPLPPDVVLLSNLVESIPKVLAQNRLTIRFEPAI